MDAHDLLTSVWWCVKPSTVAPGSLLIGIALFAVGRRRASIAALAVGAFVLLNVMVLPTARVLTAALERHVEPVRELPAVVDGIIVLGGDGAVRLPRFAELAARYPQAKLVFSGGGGEAESARRILSGVHGLAERTIFEDQSRNTYENARFSQALIRPRVDEVWVLVTSAMHMARAVDAFGLVGWRVWADPVRRRSAHATNSDSERLLVLDDALREYIAMFTQTRLLLPLDAVAMQPLARSRWNVNCLYRSNTRWPSKWCRARIDGAPGDPHLGWVGGLKWFA
jgi:uncharacterized SAM-binding protein YcdF (DUF218 family)